MSLHAYLLDESSGACPYISGNEMTQEEFIVESINEEELDALLASGYRHFGPYFFRPVCRACHKCVPLRIPVGDYVFGRSARRVLNRGRRFLVTLERPRPSHDAFKLYLKHKRRFRGEGAGAPAGRQVRDRGPDERYEEFVETFFHPFSFSYQLSVYDEERLVAVSHLDMTRQSLSAVYCYYDDTYARESLGSLAILREIEIARDRNLEWVYLGYFIAENRHMRYKARFAPNEALVEEGNWIKLLDPGARNNDNIDETGSVEFIPKFRLRENSRQD